MSNTFKPFKISDRKHRARKQAASLAARRVNIGELLTSVRDTTATYDLSSAVKSDSESWKKYDRETIVLHKIASAVVLELLPHFDNSLLEVASYLGISQKILTKWLTSSGAIECLPDEFASDRMTPQAQYRRRQIMNYFMQKYPDAFVEIIKQTQANNKVKKINVDNLR